MTEIVCVDNNWAIGSSNELLYHIPEDMKFFRSKTLGNTVVMGLATLKSFPGENPLKNRTNIVLSDDSSFFKEDVVFCSSMDELFEALSEYDSSSVYVIGGASVYAQLLPYCEYSYVTKVDSEKEADKFYPDLDENPDWEMIEESETYTYEDLEYRFTLYRNNNVLEYVPSAQAQEQQDSDE